MNENLTAMKQDNEGNRSFHETELFVTEIGPNDILLGRGHRVVNNPGESVGLDAIAFADNQHL
jgi:hypothetical protein